MLSNDWHKCIGSLVGELGAPLTDLSWQSCNNDNSSDKYKRRDGNGNDCGKWRRGYGRIRWMEWFGRSTGQQKAVIRCKKWIAKK